jgi:5-methylcytosine-specific restriction endonuclease McrA
MSTNLRTLVLNANYMPVSVFPKLYTIPAEEAIHRVLGGSCVVIHNYARPILTPSRDDLMWPSIIVNNNTKSFSKEVKLKKSTLYYRDHALCSYCNKEISASDVTYDHVIPRKKGGHHGWDNVVLSCSACNSHKGHSDPVGKWKPRRKPYVPSFYELIEIRKKFPLVIYDSEWAKFLPGFSDYIIQEPGLPSEYEE